MFKIGSKPQAQIDVSLIPETFPAASSSLFLFASGLMDASSFMSFEVGGGGMELMSSFEDESTIWKDFPSK